MVLGPLLLPRRQIVFLLSRSRAWVAFRPFPFLARRSPASFFSSPPSVSSSSSSVFPNHPILSGFGSSNTPQRGFQQASGSKSGDPVDAIKLDSKGGVSRVRFRLAELPGIPGCNLVKIYAVTLARNFFLRVVVV